MVFRPAFCVFRAFGLFSFSDEIMGFSDLYVCIIINESVHWKMNGRGLLSYSETLVDLKEGLTICISFYRPRIKRYVFEL